MVTYIKHVAEGEQAAGILFSKFKYKLQDFIAEVRSLRGKEESARLERLSIIAECKEIEVERRKEIEALRLALAEAVDIRHSLENTVKVMIQESSAVEDKHKSLNLEMKALLQSRNSLAEELKASKYDLECRLAIKVDELALMKEKLSRHACLFEAFEREASDVKRVMGETCQLVSSKEEQTIQLEKQVQALFSFEKRLIDRINHLKEDNQETQNLVLAKEKEILSLEGTVESLKFQLESVVEKTEITKALEIKDALISKLSSQKEELLTEIDNVARVSRKLQGTVTWQETTIEQLKEESVLHQKLILDLQDKLQQANTMHLACLQDKHKLVDDQKEELCRYQAKEKNWMNEQATLEHKIEELTQLISHFDYSQSKAPVAEKWTSMDRCMVFCEAATSTEDLPAFLGLSKDFVTMEDMNEKAVIGTDCCSKEIVSSLETCTSDEIPIKTSSEDKNPAICRENRTTDSKLVQHGHETNEASPSLSASNLSLYNRIFPTIDIGELSTTMLVLSSQTAHSQGHPEVTSACMIDSTSKNFVHDKKPLEDCVMQMGKDAEQSEQKLIDAEQVETSHVSGLDCTMYQEKNNSMMTDEPNSMETSRPNSMQHSSLQDDSKTSLGMINSIMFRLGRPIPRSQNVLLNSDDLSSIYHADTPEEGNGFTSQQSARAFISENEVEEEETLRVSRDETTYDSGTCHGKPQESGCISTSREHNKSYTRQSGITDSNGQIASNERKRTYGTPNYTSDKNAKVLDECPSPTLASQGEASTSMAHSVALLVQDMKSEDFPESKSLFIIETHPESPSNSDEAMKLERTVMTTSNMEASFDLSTSWKAVKTMPKSIDVEFSAAIYQHHGCLTLEASEIGVPEDPTTETMEAKLLIDNVANQVMEKSNTPLQNHQHTEARSSARTCICHNPPFGYMVGCKMCDKQFHAGCISWKGMTSEFVCDECKSKPKKRRRRNNDGSRFVAGINKTSTLM